MRTYQSKLYMGMLQNGHYYICLSLMKEEKTINSSRATRNKLIEVKQMVTGLLEHLSAVSRARGDNPTVRMTQTPKYTTGFDMKQAPGVVK